MDTRTFLDQMLGSAKTWAERGQELTEQKLGVPESGEQREAMLSGIGKGALAAGVLALLLGTGTGRKMTGAASRSAAWRRSAA